MPRQRLTTGITFLVWLPFALALGASLGVIALVYPARQAAVHRETTLERMEELARLTALSVEVGLQREDFDVLARAIEVATAAQHFSFVAIVQRDAAGTERVFVVNPDTVPDGVVLAAASATYLRRDAPVRAAGLEGRVVIGLSAAEVDAEVRALNRPILVTLGVTLLVALTLLAWVATMLTRPVRQLTAVAEALQREEFDVPITRPREPTELRQLASALTGLRDALAIAKARDTEFREGLLQAKASAEQATAAKSAFVANVSHEMRTPLNALLGLAHLCLQTPITGQPRDYVRKIEQAAQSLLVLINDVLDLSKIEVGAMTLERQPFALDDVLETVRTFTEPLAKAKGLTMQVMRDETAPNWVLGDALRLQQVLVNLAGNAVKFTELGEVCVGVAVVRREADAVELEFRVRDTGIGLTGEEQERIFRPFSQADASTTRRFGGTGLGLTISQRIVLAMGGEITVESTPGAGSIFRFHARCGVVRRPPAPVPAAAEEREDASAPLSADDPRVRLRGRRVLVAEDNDFNQLVVRELLEQAGVEVVLADDGAQALQRFAAEGPFDLVLLDVQMPVMDGLEAARRLLARPGPTLPPILAMTANVTPEDRERCRAAGMRDFIPKPIVPERLYGMLAEWVERASTPAGVASGHALFDPQLVQDLVGGDMDLLRVMGPRMLSEARSTLEAMEDAGATQDYERLARLAQALRGIAGQIGAAQCEAACDGLRRLVQAPPTAARQSRATILLRQLREDLSLIERTMAEMLA